jgi:ribonucleoside-diphosphate reductase alpha chain
MKLPTNYQEFIALSRYARFKDEVGRRETWSETVERYIQFLIAPNCDSETTNIIREAILNLEVMPSMRLLMTAGPAAKRCNVGAYNCAYIAVDNPLVFSEILYVLMCGTGVGFSVERQIISKLPPVPDSIYQTDSVIVFADSKIGWARGYKELISLLYAGLEPKLDYSKIRPLGARLKTFGGRASGPDPLKSLCEFTIAKFKGAVGRKLNSIEIHDIICKIGEIVVVGGVRRSALISLSNLSDDRMRTAKSGQWWSTEPQRALANNSACYTEKPEVGQFMAEWLSLYESKSGERGIFNRIAAEKQAIKSGRRESRDDWGCNPCSEIILRSGQFCNLSEVVIRPDDTMQNLRRKVKIATIIGTLQSTLTDFKFLRKIWKENCEEERLLGVSLTGIMDHPVMSNPNLTAEQLVEFNEVHSKSSANNVTPWSLTEILSELKKDAIETNKEWAKKLGINPSAAITCVKPSGTVSQLVDAASGIHSRFSEYYIRTVRADKKDPLAQFMKDVGFPVEDCVMRPDHVYVFSFPIKSPNHAVVSEDRTALQQLNLWKIYQDFWCEHKPSVTINVKESEWPEVGSWVWQNFDSISGVSFLPWVTHSYKQAPYQPIMEEEYLKMLQKMPVNVDWAALANYETAETTTGGEREFACTGSACEIVDVGV